ncbi:MAG: hypothetical protein IIC82_00725, partial [Chloroflexi bacterium]|nr:hypothetical protein [Chloroflexota bacterium]
MVIHQGPTAQDQCEVRSIHPQAVEEARRALLEDQAYAQLAETFSALADS